MCPLTNGYVALTCAFQSCCLILHQSYSSIVMTKLSPSRLPSGPRVVVPGQYHSSTSIDCEYLADQSKPSRFTLLINGSTGEACISPTELDCVTTLGHANFEPYCDSLSQCDSYICTASGSTCGFEYIHTKLGPIGSICKGTTCKTY